MLSSTLLLILSTLTLTPTSHSAALAPRECYISGERWDTHGEDRDGDVRGDANEALEDLCVPSKLSGVYTPGQTKTACVHLTYLKCAEFSITLHGDIWPRNFTMPDEHCKRGLRTEIYGCDRGGHKEHHNSNPVDVSPTWTLR